MENTPEELLCAAAASGDLSTLRHLLSLGADPSYFNSSGLTPLMLAASSGHSLLLPLLLSSGAPWNALSRSHLSAGDLALQNHHSHSLQILLDFALRSELILSTISRQHKHKPSGFLRERLEFAEDRVLDGEGRAVMMAWERPLMEAHARAVCGDGGGRVLNVGFGMGMVDEAMERYGPREHVIVEAHGEVYGRMMRDGWGERGNVRVVFGRWQDVVDRLGSFDGN